MITVSVLAHGGEEHVIGTVSKITPGFDYREDHGKQNGLQ